MIASPTITIIVYRPSKIRVSLGWLDEAAESTIDMFLAPWAWQKDSLRAHLVSVILADHQRRQANPWLPSNMYIMLVDGRPAEGDMKIDLDALLADATAEALSQL